MQELDSISNVYHLLSRLWLQEIDPPFVSATLMTNLGERLQALGVESPTLDDLEVLAVEYCRLLVGPQNHLPPMQSVWERGVLQSEISTSVRQFADACDYQHSTEVPSAEIDHLGVQLAIMGRLISFPARDELETDNESREAARQFFARHLRWPGPFLSQVRQQANHPFYPSVASLTEKFLKEERLVWE